MDRPARQGPSGKGEPEAGPGAGDVPRQISIRGVAAAGEVVELLAGPGGERFPKSYYIQYRVNFNPAGGGQEGIICLSELVLNYERRNTILYLPIVAGGTGEEAAAERMTGR